jgi:hypothetical protein
LPAAEETLNQRLKAVLRQLLVLDPSIRIHDSCSGAVARAGRRCGAAARRQELGRCWHAASRRMSLPHRVKRTADDQLGRRSRAWPRGLFVAEAQVGRLPVIGEDENLVGVVTLSSMAYRAPKKSEALEAAQEVSRRSARSEA